MFCTSLLFANWKSNVLFCSSLYNIPSSAKVSVCEYTPEGSTTSKNLDMPELVLTCDLTFAIEGFSTKGVI